MRTDVLQRALGLCAALLLTACLQSPPPTSNSFLDLEQSFPGDPKAQALAVAAERGDAREVRRLMKEEGVDPDTIFSPEGLPLLAWPILTGNPAGLKAMLENGANPNVAKPYPLPPDRTPRNNDNAMVWAAKADDPIYLQLLLDHGGDPDTRNVNNETLLKQARLMGNQWENVKLLVERGADVNAKSQGMTLVEMYAGLGGFMHTHWLLEHGARPEQYTLESIFWHPGNPDDPAWQRRCQQWLLQRGYQRPPMPDSYRRMREAFGFPTDEKDIPLL
ncbi:ankyrin repeat domain-containing protein [Pseudoxanthomonas sp. SE1]|uniref:ankyrin repeat domain-containing protein n=1 Tax=Pseudoxanthomonas sp. SE1 TaxID=1664560 RepID=UPI00240D6F71|nr:ankyrin repeat domain-containing protein [Pseudoxanthomonas sp. SE1]WFC41639.1 ankyrin repeat domain-containing protein [Pseudoxanthomonas sp. SE1]